MEKNTLREIDVNRKEVLLQGLENVISSPYASQIFKLQLDKLLLAPHADFWQQ